MRSKKIIKTLSIVILSIFVLFMLLFGLTFFIILNPQKNYKKLFNSLFDKTIKIVEKGSSEELIGSINKGNIKIDTNVEKYSNLSNYEIEYDIENDRKDNKSLVVLKFGDEEENLEGTFYYENDYLYIDFPYIMSDTIKVSPDDYNIKSANKIINYSKEDATYLLSTIKNSFIDTINTNDSINNSISNNYVKSTYTIDNNEFEKLINAIVNDLIKDEKSMNILLNSFSITENKLVSFKNKMIELFNKNNEKIELNIYNSFLFKLRKITINTNDYNVELLLNDTNELSIKSNNKELLKSSFNNEMIKSIINRNSKTIETDLKIDTSKDEYNFDGYVSFNENNEYIKLDLSLSTLLNEDLNEYDISLAKSFNQFTKKDLQSVYKIVDIINKYIELFTSDNSNNIVIKK